jgi:hypothetical protein
MSDTYSSSLLTNAQVRLATKYNEAELRRKERPVIAMGMRNAAYTIPDFETVKTAEARTVEVKYLKQKAAGAAIAKVAVHTGTKGGSGTLNLAWGCITETFYISAKQAQNNVIGLNTMFDFELEQAIDNLKDRAETIALAYAASHNCQVASPATSGAGTWDGQALSIAESEKEYFVQLAKTFMRGRYFRGELDMIPDLRLWPLLERTMWQGSGNDRNLNPQMQGVTFAPTTETINGSYTNGSALVMPAGTFKMMDWNDPLNRSNKNEGNNNVGMFTTLLDPQGSGIRFDVSKYSARGDESSNGGGVQDVLDQWEVSLWYAFGVPPLVAASDSPIHIIAKGS